MTSEPNQEVTQGTCRRQTIGSLMMTCAPPKSYTDASRDGLGQEKKWEPEGN